MADSLLGLVVDEVEYVVEEGKIREFARATFVEDPVHTDGSVARERGLSAPAATATHVVVAGHHRDQRAFVARLGLDIAEILVPDQAPLELVSLIERCRAIEPEERPTIKEVCDWLDEIP